MTDMNFKKGRRKRVSQQFAKYLLEYYNEELKQLSLTTEAGADQVSVKTDRQRSTGAQANQVKENSTSKGETERTEVSILESDKEALETKG